MNEAEREENLTFEDIEKDARENHIYKYHNKKQLIEFLIHYRIQAYLFCAKYLALKKQLEGKENESQKV